MERAATLPDFSMRIMASILAEEGIDARSALAAAQLPENRFSDIPGTVNGEQEAAFQREFVRLTGYRPDLWIRTGLRYRLPSYGALGMAVMTASTLREANETSRSSWAFNFSLTAGIEVQTRGGSIGHALDVSSVPEDLADFTIYRDVAATLILLSDLCNGKIPLDRVTIALSAPSRKPVTILGQTVVFDADQTGWFWPVEAEEQALRHGDPVLHDAYMEELRTRLLLMHKDDNLMTSLTEALRSLDGGQISLPRIASSIGLSERTLQRRLEARGLKFRDVVDESRRRLAIDMLTSSDISVSEIAWKLGYADVASFNHAFRRWTGASPSVVRHREERC